MSQALNSRDSVQYDDVFVILMFLKNCADILPKMGTLFTMSVFEWPFSLIKLCAAPIKKIITGILKVEHKRRK